MGWYPVDVCLVGSGFGFGCFVFPVNLTQGRVIWEEEHDLR